MISLLGSGLGLLLGLLIISACGNKDTFHKGADDFIDAGEANFKVSDVLIVENSAPPVDILWVIDNSGSMGSYQQAVKDNMSTFMQQLTADHDLDWQMAVLSTDTRDKPFLGMGSVGSFSYLAANPVSVFNSAVAKLGISGAGVEKSITPILNAVNQYPTFFRRDSVLAMLVVTDAPEQSTESVNLLLANLATKKDDPKKIISYGAFAAKDLGCQTTDDPWNYQGSKYQALINANNGKYFPLCSNNFGANLASIAQNISVRTQHAKLLLPVAPDPASISIYYAPRNQAQSRIAAGVNWQYVPSEQAIEISDVSTFSDPQGTLTVKFIRAK